MKVMLFGATGMVGQGVLRECLLNPAVKEILSISRTRIEKAGDQSIDPNSTRLRQIIRPDLFDLADLDSEFAAVDACIFSLGVSSFRMSEANYRRITYDLTLSVAQRFVRVKPEITFLYVSGAGTDSSAKTKTMWARVKGETENALLALPFRAAFMLRPGAIVPLNGIRSKTAVYQIPYTLLAPLLPLLAHSFPRRVTDTQQLGRVMLRLAQKGIAQEGPPRRVLESIDIARM
jgi:uncharacterized protein YbjT (DUF2867 family)